MAAAVEGRRLAAPRPGLLALGLALAALLTHAAAFGTLAPWGRLPLAGTLIVLAGAGWAAWAAWWLRLVSQPARLVDEGPFRYGRNPMALGTGGVMLGAAGALGVPTLALAAAAFIVLMQWLHLPAEEAALQRAYGGWYIDYRHSVRRWL